MAKDVIIKPARGILEVKATNGSTIENKIEEGNIDLTGTITGSGYNDFQRNTGYTYSNVGHLPLTGGTLTGQLNVTTTPYGKI